VTKFFPSIVSFVGGISSINFCVWVRGRQWSVSRLMGGRPAAAGHSMRGQMVSLFVCLFDSLEKARESERERERERENVVVIGYNPSERVRLSGYRVVFSWGVFFHIVIDVHPDPWRVVSVYLHVWSNLEH